DDGKIELIANSYRSDAIIFYKYNSDPHDSSNWSRYVIDSSAGGGNSRRPIMKFIKFTVKEKLLGEFTSGAHYTAIADMNGDGRSDLIIACDHKNYDIVWYETPKDIRRIPAWTKHIVYKNDLYRTYHVETGDIDGDGDRDIAFTTKTDNSIGWVENTGLEGQWHSCLIDNNCVSCFNVRVADIDKDGKDEIIASEDDSKNGGKLHLYKYSGNPIIRESWKRYDIAVFPVGHGVSVFEIIDIDNDGDLDIVTGNHQGDIYVLENSYPYKVLDKMKTYKVTSYALDSDHDFREIDVGDIDNDTNNDIIVADEIQNMIIWFENPGMSLSETWMSHIIDKSSQYLKWCHCVELEDIDGDGDLDITVAAAGSNVFLLYFNKLNKKDINQ
ncbi:MAG: FG-GAP repeat domain-containing protein, partial [Candidatus Hodarchaeales archaeon]